jgi:3-hydroxybutyryl-CoA dehydrogenase
MITGVIGAGIMGSGIAQQAAMSGCEVRLYDISSEKLNKALQDISLSLGRFASKGVIQNQEISGILGRIYSCTSIDALSDCQLIIEAIAEDLNLKKELFSKLEKVVSDDCILATNTSSLSITSIASVLKTPERFIGIHFFNPVVLMQLTEIIPAIQSKDEIIDKTINIIESWGKQVVKAKDTPGFIVNKVARPFYSEAIRIMEEAIADTLTIDEVMRNSGFKMGPFELMDFIGHDVNYRVTESVWKSFYYDSRYRPSFSQLRLLEAGFLGKKSGKGFYDYPNTNAQVRSIDPELIHKIFYAYHIHADQ